MTSPSVKKIIESANGLVSELLDTLKTRNSENIFSGDDLKQLIDGLADENNGPLKNTFLESLINELLSEARAAAQPVGVAYLGPEGTFSNIAMNSFFGTSVKGHPVKTIPDVFRSVEKSEVEYGVVPIENSTEGSVTYTLDELMDTSLHIIAEKSVRITFSLLSLSGDISRVKKVYTHPQPAGQARIWLRNNLPSAEIVYVDSTTKAAELAAADDSSAAISSDIAAGIYGLAAAARSIEDLRQNFTRFCVLGRSTSPRTGNDKTSIACSVKDKPGALIRLLTPMSELAINMTRIESRPDKKTAWQYNFFIDITGHRDDPGVREALDRMLDETIFIKILGSYPAGNTAE
jgi:chorismate mutase/prephenate dehydratase